MKISKLTKINSKNYIKKYLTMLRNGGLLIFPSDTVYGLLVDATNEKAVQKLIAFKNRPIGKAISVFVSDMNMLNNYVKVDEKQQQILDQLLPGPFTVVLQSKKQTSPFLESEKGTLGVRIPDYPLIIDLVKAYGKPLTATSANISGKAPHHSIKSLFKQLSSKKKELVDIVVDADQLPHNKPSTVIDLTTPTVKILRHGDVVWKHTQTYISKTPNQTQKLAQYILEKNLKIGSKKPLIFILKGDLGVGKTIFVKGLAAALGIHTIISPTFTIYYEYLVKDNVFIKNLYHFDLYNIEDPEEFKHLGIMSLLKPKIILAFEWGEKTADIFEMLQSKANVLFIEMTYIDEKTREITIKY